MNTIKNFFENKIYFKLTYLIVSLIFVTFVGEYGKVSSIGSKLMIVWSIILFIYIIVFKKIKLNTNLIYIILSFLMLRILSTAITGFNKENIITIFVDAIMLFLILDVFMDEKYKKTSLEYSVFFINLILTIPALASFLCYILKYWFQIGESYFGYIDKLNYMGVFKNENALGIACAISFILTIYLIYRTRKIILKIIGILNLIMLAFVFLNCNATNALLIVAVFIASFIFLILKKGIYRVIYLFFSALSLGYVSYKYDVLGHIQAILNGRYELWTTSLKVIKENMLFGVGHTNLIDQMKSHTETALPGIEGGGLHNLFLQILTVSGILVFISFIILIIFLIVKIIIKNDRIIKNNARNSNNIIIAFLIAVLASNMFEANLLYIISFISIVFWTILGCIYNKLEYK